MNKTEFISKYFNEQINIKTDVFEEMILKDLIANGNEDIKIKLNRNLTKFFVNWIYTKIDNKENISISIKGITRSGKSLTGLKIAKLITDYYNNKLNYKKDFKTSYIVCGNQKEYRLKLKNAFFGDVFQIDENVFTNVGIGGATEESQLKDIQNIIAKKNIHTIYITPRVFLNSNSELGLSYLGKDTKNWIGKFLLYLLRGGVPKLLGYVLIDIKDLFIDTGCYVFKQTGGCTNPNRLDLKDIKKELIKNSKCLNHELIKNNDLRLTDNDIKSKLCPFYRICQSEMVKYEHKKDEWISKEMSGGLDERTAERFRIALNILEKVGTRYPDMIKLKVKSSKELAIKVNLMLHNITNTKLTKTELDEVLNIVKSLTDYDFLKEVCQNLKINYEEYLEKLNKK